MKISIRNLAPPEALVTAKTRFTFVIFFVTLFFMSGMARNAMAMAPALNEQYVVIFDFSGTFVKDPGNIASSIATIREFAEKTELKREKFKEEAEAEARGRRLSIPKVGAYFTLVGLGSRPRVIWSGDTANFIDLGKKGEISRLVKVAVEDARKLGDTRCTDISGALDLGFRRFTSRNPRRELIVRGGVIMFSDLLDDPPNLQGRCLNKGNPAPPEGPVWDDFVYFLEENRDRANNPPAFYPRFFFIALGVAERAKKVKDPGTLWTEKLVSLQPETTPFHLEFRSFADAVNYSIPVPPRITSAEVFLYLDNFDSVDGTRISEKALGDGKGGDDFFKYLLLIGFGFMAMVFTVILFFVTIIGFFVYLQRRRRGRPAS